MTDEKKNFFKRLTERIIRTGKSPYTGWAVAAALLATSFALASMAFHHKGDITHAIRVGKYFYYKEGVAKLVSKSEPTIDPQNGFDGQFYYYLAHDPLMVNPATVNSLDAPHLRGRRIFYPFAARLLVRHRGHIPEGLLYILLISVFGTAFVAASYLKDKSLSPLWVFCAVLTVTFAVPTDYLTCEPLAAFLVILALWAWGRERWKLAWAATALAILTKEPSVALAAAFVFDSLLKKKWKHAVAFALAVAPFGLWAIYLKIHLDVPTSPMDMAKNFTLPFAGALRLLPHDIGMIRAEENERVYMLRILARFWFLIASVVLLYLFARKRTAATTLGALAALNALTLSSGAEAPSYDYMAHFARQLYLVPPVVFVLWIETRNRTLKWLLILSVPLAIQAWRLLIIGKFI